ncbi:SDR family oxidoreductase [Shewanella sairae]|uniref:SDR family oxidoreductase n=1 Tax=Shewanella sairae TaxID=190310 RepID=A0ABQ4PPS7_9GAMM|nr:SDR family NAD(P)-dependent oxidoreductase [Shewanella sairae]MCL1130206.1 SDR family NAD(P)-dependent oxidoreductase [Shewanella sairae]GIU50862.1 SDR family oxidoreductase [Shewanella sairae]
MNVLVVGGSGGIGLALVEHYLATNTANVFATYRTNKPALNHPKLVWYKVNVTVESDIEELAKLLPKLSLLVNAVGMLHDGEHNPEKSVKEFDSNFFNKNIVINVTPSLLLASYFAEHLKSKTTSHFVTVSAKIGSIEDNRLGGWVSYRSSKAALNMAMKTISIEWRFKLANTCVLVFHPGTTDTELSKRFQRNVPEGKLFTAEYVADCLSRIIRDTSASDTGKFYSYDGSILPW